MEPPVDQKLLEDFLSLCRHRSFSHAAQERNVTQPAFSRRIRALEEWLGVVLFDRTALPRSASRRRENSSCPWHATSWTAWPKPGGSSRPGTVPTASSASSACLPSPSTCSRSSLPGAADVRSAPLCGQSLSSKRGRAFLRPDGTSGGHAAHLQAGRV